MKGGKKAAYCPKGIDKLKRKDYYDANQRRKR